MDTKQLEALAIYRTHKRCQCPNCQKAREILAEFDKHNGHLNELQNRKETNERLPASRAPRATRRQV